MNLQQIEMEWIAAVVAPWTVSPHPNFSGGEVSAAQGLALITERRERDGNKADPELKTSWPDWAREIIEAARLSLVVDSQRQATASLWALAQRSELPVGSRVAAAIYASLGSLELDESDESVDLLGDLIAVLKGSGVPEQYSPSYRLAIGVLAQQRVVRAQDAARYQDARTGLAEVLAWLPNLDATGLEIFPVSKGISWSSSRVQKDIIAATKQNAISSKAQLEQFTGSTWVQVVRSRSGWIDLRHYLLERNRNAAVLRNDFEMKFDSTSGKRILGRESQTEVAYVALLAAELSGDSVRARHSRAEMAKVHLLEVGDKQFHTREALRLLRQSGSTAPLKSALSWIRAEGPLDALRDDARTILERAVRDRYASESDLLVLESAADLLEREQLVEAIEVASLYFETQQRNDRVGWSHLDNVWRAIGRFVAGSDEDDAVAGKAAELLSQPKSLTRPLSNTIAGLVAEIDWSQVGDENRAIWAKWVTEQSTSDPEVDALVFELRDALGMPGPNVVASGLEAAAILADEGMSKLDGELKIVEARGAIIASLRAEVESAKIGHFGFGGISPSNVGVAFAIRFGDMQVWDEVVQHLIDPKVVSGHKAPALDRLASNAHEVPATVRGQLSENWRIIADSPRDSWFGGESLPLFPEAFRMAAAFGALTSTEGVEAVLQLASGSDKGKIEASLSMPFIAPSEDVTWAHVLLLQLAEDENPNVRAEAGFAMIRLLSSESTVSDMVSKRARHLLASDGVRCALRILHGLQSISEAQPALVEPWLSAASTMAESDPRRVVRGAAQELLRMMKEAER